MKPRTKAVERDLCAALDHLLLHRSRTSHACKCGYRTVWGEIESGECPECNELTASDDESVMISYAHNLTGRSEWLERRRQGIGGSDAAAVLGLSPWKSPLALWSEKTGLVEDISEDTEWKEWGHILEEPIARKYTRETGRELLNYGEFYVFEHPKISHMICTIDREILPFTDRVHGILSIKTAAGWKAGEWKEEPPLMYQVQLQHELAVTGLEWGSFAVLIGGQMFRWCDVERHDRFISYLIEKESEFWDRVVRGDPPPVDASDSSREILSRLYPKDTGESVELPPDSIAWDEQLQFAKAEIKAAEHRKQEAENNLKAAIGNATIGLLPGGGCYSWKAALRAGYTVEPTTIRTLRRLKK
jgi:putative phage-type endonuclease